MGVGLAATQLGVLRRLLVFQAGPDSEPTALVNPEVEWLSDEVVVAEEGCLSLPRVSMDVERPLHARFSGLDVDGEPMRIEASGLEARVLQHEIDHLDGVLILDRAPRAQRKGALRALREGGSYSPPLAEQDDGDEGEHREPRSDAVRTVYLGTSEFAGDGAAPAGRVGPPAAAGRHPARPAQGPRPPHAVAAGRRGRRGARDRAAAGRERQRRGGAGADPRRRGPRRSPSAPSAS